MMYEKKHNIYMQTRAEEYDDDEEEEEEIHERLPAMGPELDLPDEGTNVWA